MDDMTLLAKCRERFVFDGITGQFFSLPDMSPVRMRICAKGYQRISIGRDTYRGHRIAWLMHYGQMPEGVIDHINCVKSDNRIANLRAVSPAINRQNQRAPQRNNKSGFLGVSWHKRDLCWVARITVCGKKHNLGAFDSAEQAACAYLKAKRQVHAGCTF